MNTLSIKTLLKERGIIPRKTWGQNFLVDSGAVHKVLEAAKPTPDTPVLEIGPGVGSLTLPLLEIARKVVAVEKDERMVAILKELASDKPNLTLINQDILTWDPSPFFSDFAYEVVSNLPYSISSPVIRKFLGEVGTRPRKMTVVIQKEVGQRICANVPDMNLLAVSVQAYATPKILGYIPKNCFWPQPEVDSAILSLIPNGKNRDKTFFRVVKTGFSQPRKQLINNFKGLDMSREDIAAWLEKNNISPTQRAETLSLEDWGNLAATLLK